MTTLKLVSVLVILVLAVFACNPSQNTEGQATDSLAVSQADTLKAEVKVQSEFQFVNGQKVQEEICLLTFKDLAKNEEVAFKAVYASLDSLPVKFLKLQDGLPVVDSLQIGKVFDIQFAQVSQKDAITGQDETINKITSIVAK